MIDFLTPLFAAVDLSEVAGGAHERVTYEFARLEQLDDSRWLLGLLAAIVAAVALLAVGNYVRESRNLPRAVGAVLCSLRLLAIAGAVLFFLNLQKRTDQQTVTQSRVAILVDTSQSMSVRDEAPLSSSEPLARSEAVAEALTRTPWIDILREENDVSLAVFDRNLRRLAEWKRHMGDGNAENAAAPSEPSLPNQPKAGDASDRGGAGGDNSQAEVGTGDSWSDRLIPLGVETRLGDAIAGCLDQRRGQPLAGIVVLSDGGQNSGLDPLAVTEAARQLKVPLFTVGIGSSQPRRNIRVKQLIAPSRVYPEDKITIRGLIQAEGYRGRSVDVELYLRELDGAEGVRDRVGRQQINFLADGEAVPVAFEIEPVEVGRLQLDLQLVAPADDQYLDDNRRSVEMEVIETETRVLLLADGATRDYRFLRNQLRRDRHATVDVCLQSAPPGISQDADQILATFPETKEQLYEYDCIVAFDPDWTLLDARQVDLLEKWVAEEAGGLIVVAGPIHTAGWIQSPEHAKIRALYPVEFQRRLTLLDDGQYGSKVPWPIEFSRDGWEADFLWLADTSEASRPLWSQFAGVFGCYAVRGPKPGARVLGRYSDPEAGISTELPVYLAEHFYGAGRVFYIGSGEMWRLRQLDPGYFEVLYTQLIRHVSQGRLLRGSSLGNLMVERDRYTVGDTVVVRAQLSTASREPLIADRVTGHVVSPGGDGRNLKLLADVGRAGNFVGQFTVLKQGTYRIELPVPDALDEQLARRIEVVAPNLEYEKTRRNESLLAAIATRTGGRYYASLASAIDGSDSVPPLARLLDSRAEEKIIRGGADPKFTEWLNRILLAVICGCLCLEWFLRRLMKLA